MEFEKTVIDHYEKLTEGFYIHKWNGDHIHLGLFEPGELPPLIPTQRRQQREFDCIDRACERMIDEVVAPAGIDENSHVVDAGCGVGGTAIRLVNLWNCRVTGVNICEKQLAIANRKVEELGLGGQIDLKYANCSQSLPFGDNSIDAVVNIESAYHYPDRETFLGEVHRILKPGGRIATQDPMVPDSMSKEEYERFVSPVCEAWSVYSFESPSSYTRMLRRAGFEILEFSDFGDRDLDNIRILENDYTNIFAQWLDGSTHVEISIALELMGPLIRAWKSRHIQLQRYCAEKPAP
ncbi:MAG: methyltransferase domain-containing protein [Rhodobacter sp.]|nr:methyltransferase domain-containing protein [Rhodobacter sp.]MCY4242014.1 methyltransferase domain-containing protein [Rhodobacter sp.]